ncbi:MAG: DUF167 domain-containing protein [Propionicimonas sp.]
MQCSVDSDGRNTIRVTVRVKPGASRTRVGGRYGEDALVIAVTAPAVEGRATEAALHALAKALGCPTRRVTLVTGAASRTKVVDVPDACAQTVAGLLEA